MSSRIAHAHSLPFAAVVVALAVGSDREQVLVAASCAESGPGVSCRTPRARTRTRTRTRTRKERTWIMKRAIANLPSRMAQSSGLITVPFTCTATSASAHIHTSQNVQPASLQLPRPTSASGFALRVAHIPQPPGTAAPKRQPRTRPRYVESRGAGRTWILSRSPLTSETVMRLVPTLRERATQLERRFQTLSH
eukprot:641059-Rhodomonas_salina.5